MKNIEDMREQLKTTQKNIGVAIGICAVSGVMYEAANWPAITSGAIFAVALGKAAHDGMKAHSLGQEIANASLIENNASK